MAKIDCLMGTYGRQAMACEALACFLEQTALADATLLIYNQHPIPLRFEHPRVRIVNETLPSKPLRYIRRRMIDLADSSAEFLHFWDDDDLCLPWHLEHCLAHIGDNVAWKPAASWMCHAHTEFGGPERNFFEGSWLFRADYVRSAPVTTHERYIDHPVYMQAIEAGLLAETDFRGRTSYIYRWANGAEHISGYGGDLDQATQFGSISKWRENSRDVRPDGRMTPADLTLRWQQYLEGTRNLTTRAEWMFNRSRLGF